MKEENKIINLVPRFTAYRNAFFCCLFGAICFCVWFYSELDWRMTRLEFSQGIQESQMNNINLEIRERILAEKIINEKLAETCNLANSSYERSVKQAQIIEDIRNELTNTEKNTNINKDLLKELLKVIKNLNKKED